MKVTAREEYGLRCLLQLAKSAESPQPITVREIADEEGLSAAYAEKLLRVLSRAGLAHSIRGTRGGYRLSRSPERVSLGEAMRALGGVVSPGELCSRFRGREERCTHLVDCGLRPVWSLLNRHIESALDKVPLTTLLEREKDVARALHAAVKGAWTPSAIGNGGIPAEG